MLYRCRDLIEEHAPADEKENLLAVSQVFTHLRYNDPKLFSIFGGKKMVVELPLIQEILAERVHKDILTVLESRFGEVPEDLADQIRSVSNDNKLTELIRKAASSASLESFRRAVKSSSRTSKKSRRRSS
jgi:hypothetical protein